jgi:hypothetical protein
MKTLLVAVISLALVATSAHAGIGESVKQVEARYGKPQKIFIDRPDLRKVGYGYRGFMVLVYFSGGVSRRESFRQPGVSRVSSDAVAQLLALSAVPGTLWAPWEPSTAEKGEQYWMRSDGAVLASSGTYSGMTVILFQDPNFKSSE